MKKNFFESAGSVLLILLGNALYALTIQMFFLKSGIIIGGTTGIALCVNHYWGIPMPPFILAFNVLMLVLGLLFLGKKFVLTTIISSFAYPVFLELFELFLPDTILIEDPILCTVFSGLGIGLALGIIIRCGASSGGMDIPPLLLNRFFKVPVSAGLYLFDFAILALQFSFRPMDKILYGIILTLIYTIVLDKMLFMGASRTEVKVISSHMEEIRQAILSRMDRGVTVLYGEGGYLKQPAQMVVSIISNRELAQVERLIHQIDPECFMIISRVSEVSGRGFSLKKQYR